MTTKVIREALETLVKAKPERDAKSIINHEAAYDAALEAVEAIERVARTILESGRLDGAPMKREVEVLERIAKAAP